MKILFLCTLNAVRSPIAEALAKEYYPAHQFRSAGLMRGPIDYFAVEVMQEIGLDISNHEPFSFEKLKSKSFDLVVCLTDEYRDDIAKRLKESNLKFEFWDDIPNPGNLSGSRLMKIYGYREIRDKIKARLKNWEFSKKLEA